MRSALPLAALALVALGAPAPARAQWTRVADVPAAEVGVVLATDAALYAGALDAVYVSRDGGATWTRSAPLPADVDGVWALAVHAGRLFAGGYGGVLESADDGATWTRRDDGLVGLGARDVTGLVVHDGFLFAATAGAGVFGLDLAAAAPVWTPYGYGLPFNVDALVATAGGLVAGAGANGFVFLRADGAPAWAGRPFTPFDPNGPHMWALAEHAGALVGGSSHGFFRSADGGETWARFDPGVGLFSDVSLAADGGRLYALATTGRGVTYVAASDDGGVTWPLLESLRGVTTYGAAVAGGHLFAGRLDGLWARPLYPTGTDASEAPPALGLPAPAPAPFTTATRIAYDLGAPADVALAVFDVLGRRVATLAEGPRPAGRHVAVWAPGDLPAGTYVVRLSAGGHHASRLVHRVD